jgi:hypothetical protein
VSQKKQKGKMENDITNQLLFIIRYQSSLQIFKTYMEKQEKAQSNEVKQHTR